MQEQHGRGQKNLMLLLLFLVVAILSSEVHATCKSSDLHLAADTGKEASSHFNTPTISASSRSTDLGYLTSMHMSSGGL
ncbi:glutamine-rich protein 1 [Sarotherodon galilaeus]